MALRGFRQPSVLSIRYWSIIPLGVLSGCGSLGSSLPVNAISSKPLSGVPYQLPKVILEISATRTTNGIDVRISQPIYIGDSSATYLLRYVPDEAAVDTFKVKVNSATMLLTTFNGEADDKTAEAIRLLTTGSPRAKPEGSGVIEERLFSAVFDPSLPSEVSQVSAGLNTAVFEGLRARLGHACEVAVRAALGTDTKKSAKEIAEVRKATRAKTETCRAERRLTKPNFALSVVYTPVVMASSTVNACAVGVCTRSPGVAFVSASDGVAMVATQKFMMPNGGSAIPIDLRRAFSTKATYSMVFTNGLAESVERTKGSSLVAVASLPLDVFRNVLTSASQIIQLRIDQTTKEKELIAARQQLIEARAARDKAIETAAKAKSGTTESGVDDALLTLTLPGFGKGSGFELTEPAQLNNEATGSPKPAPTSQTPTKADDTKPPAKPAAKPTASETLGGPVSGGGSGTDD
jgi:hypothetical protein